MPKTIRKAKNNIILVFILSLVLLGLLRNATSVILREVIGRPKNLFTVEILHFVQNDAELGISQAVSYYTIMSKKCIMRVILFASVRI